MTMTHEQRIAAIKASIPSPAEFERRRQAREDDRRYRATLDLFNPINLGHWIALCHEANVPYVPAEEIARVPTQDVTMFDEENPPATSIEFWKMVDAGMKARGDNWMVRWACCACDPVKYRLGTGKPEWHPDLASLRIDDFRAFDIVCDFPEPTIAAYARPWMKSAIIDSYPVEYRVFVSHNQIDGICNYYPQRPLPNDGRTLFDIVLCFQYAVRLLKAQVKPLNCPRLEKHWDTTQNHWTADFLRTKDGKILFLEGGPPHTVSGGAHPCCFPIGKAEGIALAAGAEELAAMGLETSG